MAGFFMNESFKVAEGTGTISTYATGRPDSVTFVGVLNTCIGIVSVAEGRCVREQIIQSGCKSDAFGE
jgi:hypothetical protein